MLVALILFSYTMYLWIGIAGALREVEDNIEITGIHVSNYVNGNASVSINVSVYNPTEFSLRISYMAIKEIQVNGRHIRLYSGSHQFPNTFKCLNLGLQPFSGELISFNFSLDENILNSGNWTLLLRVHINTIFNEENPLRLDVLCVY